MSVCANRIKSRWLASAVVGTALLGWAGTAMLQSQPPDAPKSSYDQIAPALLGTQSFADMMAKDKADKPAVMERQKKLLEERYDLTPHERDVKMTRGKAVLMGP